MMPLCVQQDGEKVPDCTAAAVLLQFLLPLSMPRGFTVDEQKQCCTRLPMTCFCLALSKCTQIRPQTKCKYFKFISFSSRQGPTFWSHSTTSTFFTHSTVEDERQHWHWLGNWFRTICTNDETTLFLFAHLYGLLRCYERTANKNSFMKIRWQ